VVLPRIGIARRVAGVCVTVDFVAKFGCLAFTFLVASGASGCLLYTDPINRPPVVKLTGDSRVTWGMGRARYHAEAHDPDQSAASLTFEWRRQLGACPNPDAPLMGPPLASSGPDLDLDGTFTEPFCVGVVVRDSDKAFASATLPTQVMHEGSTADIDLVLPRPASDEHYPLFSAVRLSGAGSMDPEHGKLTFRWTLTRNTTTLTVVPCPQAPDTDICFTADQPGDYVATLTVEDTRGGKAMKERKLVVDPDAPPCIRRAEPEIGLARIVRDPEEETRFQVFSVEDDGDPFPPREGQTSSFAFTATWWMEGEDPTNPSGRRPADQAQNPLVKFEPKHFRNGDTAYVRIQVTDRVNRNFSTCAADKRDCAIGKDPTCFQWVTWKVDFVLLGGTP
jgi:hypothetical protein